MNGSTFLFKKSTLIIFILNIIKNNDKKNSTKIIKLGVINNLSLTKDLKKYTIFKTSITTIKKYEKENYFRLCIGFKSKWFTGTTLGTSLGKKLRP